MSGSSCTLIIKKETEIHDLKHNQNNLTIMHIYYLFCGFSLYPTNP